MRAWALQSPFNQLAESNLNGMGCSGADLPERHAYEEKGRSGHL